VNLFIIPPVANGLTITQLATQGKEQEALDETVCIFSI